MARSALHAVRRAAGNTPLWDLLRRVKAWPGTRHPHHLPPVTADNSTSTVLVARPGLLAHDSDWQHPAITERHAFLQMQRLLPAQPAAGRVVYLGFPWATLIDLKERAAHRTDKIAELETALAHLAQRARGHDRVITVCQHIHMRHMAPLFRAAGVTDIYWSHAVKGQQRMPEAPGITLHPFPLFPVQQTEDPDPEAARPILYSFVGAGGTALYLTQVRRWIMDQLAQDPRGQVTERQAWHYDRVVYDSQVGNHATPDTSLVDVAAAEDFRDVMGRSVFALCPSGTGPNSIRLWEAALAGTIPVLLADTWRAPGPDWLWQAATVPCPETQAAVARLPDRLERLAGDPAAMDLRRRALALLVQAYGPDRFVQDILPQFAVHADDDPLRDDGPAQALRQDLPKPPRIWQRLRRRAGF
ncbi:MAG: glycosyltransferase family 47 protein [Alphaproteobacteria bacterium]|nr:glycosyltransferase family 47 protein [Alphaproteobacteria bacterium]